MLFEQAILIESEVEQDIGAFFNRFKLVRPKVRQDAFVVLDALDVAAQAASDCDLHVGDVVRAIRVVQALLRTIAVNGAKLVLDMYLKVVFIMSVGDEDPAAAREGDLEVLCLKVIYGHFIVAARFEDHPPYVPVLEEDLLDSRKRCVSATVHPSLECSPVVAILSSVAVDVASH